jgi:hypothetical protein
MKITILGTAKFEEGTAKFEEDCVQIGITFVFDKGAHRREHLYMINTGYGMSEWNKQKSEPLYIQSDDLPMWSL